MSGALIDGHDAVLFDLDGVVYLGPNPVPTAPDTIAELRRRGVKVGFVTNNAARSAVVVARHLTDIGIPTCPDDVVTSAQAVCDLAARSLPAGVRVLVVGTESLREEAIARGLLPVESAKDDPVAVIQGYDSQVSWSKLEEAGFALQAGARWYAANPDITRPTDRGIVPGIGAQLQVVASTCDVQPIFAGKPYRPLLDATISRLGSTSPIFVGDRLDTDIRGANAIGIDSLFVFTGAHGVTDLLNAVPEDRPNNIAADLSGLFEPKREVVMSGERAQCGDVTVSLDEDRALRPEGVPEDACGQLDAVAAMMVLVYGMDATVPDDAARLFDKLH
ncbi:HAD-IIA family hydrolase [Cutibacterium sp. WCA-380-WT-3A]|uniref:HAD-IIA family hydrolase n=1 Tax=Cutibacterium porci TaxID=2605781 RepID=A0A7K0J5J7_9ACTN|nr:HAD-IIA family hydrolase [Cutibacterium porci]MSS45216.1 HAD-IIA family hydrolase [Cutibacterium porci]